MGGRRLGEGGLKSAHLPMLAVHWQICDAHHFELRSRNLSGVDVTQMDAGLIKTLIVDDEPVARKLLREELELLPEIAIIGEAANGREALQKIGKLKPDLVFLDLQMPVMSGFEVVHGLGGSFLPVIVIVTAFDQHAIQAFDAGAIDYLLKPVSEARLLKAVE